MAGELASAIGLGAVLKPVKEDNTIRNAMLKQMALRNTKSKNDDDDKDAASTLKDMVATKGDLLPAYSEAMKKTNGELVGKAMEIFNDGKPNPKTRLWEYYTQNILPKQQGITTSNSEANNYIKASKENKNIGYDDVINGFLTEKDINKLHQTISAHQDPTVMSTDDGYFSYIPVSPFDYSKWSKIDSKTSYIADGRPEVTNVGGVLNTVQKMTLNPDIKAAKREQLLNDQTYVLGIGKRIDYATRSDAALYQQAVLDAADADVEKYFPTYYEKVTNTNAPKPQSTNVFGGTSKDWSNEKWRVATQASGSMSFSTFMKDSDGSLYEDVNGNKKEIGKVTLGEGYIPSWLGTAGEEPLNNWSSTSAFNITKGTKEANFSKQGVYLGTFNGYTYTNKSTGKETHSNAYYALIKSGKGENTQYYLLPYKNVSGAIKSYTSAPKSDGWGISGFTSATQPANVETKAKTQPVQAQPAKAQPVQKAAKEPKVSAPKKFKNVESIDAILNSSKTK